MNDAQRTLVQPVMKYIRDTYGRLGISSDSPKYPKVHLDSSGNMYLIKNDNNSSNFSMYSIEDMGPTSLPLKKIGTLTMSGVSIAPQYHGLSLDSALLDYSDDYNSEEFEESYSLTPSLAPPPPVETSITHNPKFIKWFSNSVVRNRDGSPAKCYHISKDGGFTEFEIAQNDIGIHFGSLEQAHDRGGFTDKQMKYTFEEYLETSDDEPLMDYSTFIKSPLCLEMINDYRSSDGQSIYPVYLRLCKPLIIRDMREWNNGVYIAEEILRSGGVVSGLSYDLKEFIEKQDYITPGKAPNGISELRGILQSYGHEGLVYRNIYEEGSEYGEYSYCVFSAGQIKSAITNKGTYELNSSKITESKNEASPFILPEIDANLVYAPINVRAIKAYGITDNPGDAFYILPDGQLLDGSQRNEGNKYGGRTLDHRNVSQLIRKDFKSQGSWTRQMQYFMLRSGCIRMNLVNGGNFIDSVNVPNVYQRRAICEIFKTLEMVDLWDSKFNRILSKPLRHVSRDSLLDFYNKYADEFDSFDGYDESVESLEDDSGNSMRKLL